MPQWAQFGLQDAVSPVIAILTGFHDHAILIISLIITFITYALLRLSHNSYLCRNIYEAQEVETVWTVLPTITLLFLALPSLRILYLIEEITNPAVTIKCVAHQWYWRYEYSDFLSLEFDSYIVQTEDLHEGGHRLLEVDNRTVIPIGVEIRILITSADVIHSWALPALGIKIDAIPGRLNQIGFITIRPGIFYGQCSEICGANHSFIPIALESVDHRSFIDWISSIREWKFS